MGGETKMLTVEQAAMRLAEARNNAFLDFTEKDWLCENRSKVRAHPGIRD